MESSIDIDIAAERQAAELTRRKAVIAGLRQLATFLEIHPELPCSLSPLNCVVCVNTKAELADIARVTTGVKWEKDFSSSTYFSLKARFEGDVTYDVFVERSEVCRKVITGTRLETAQPAREVEEFRWECDEPLLAEQAGAR